ncbi:MAG: hypothetical protein HY401_09535 [Elusimicrobia bacterium]|nr:hypothetical protein [Elusimicrobiota bacterium]
MKRQMVKLCLAGASGIFLSVCFLATDLSAVTLSSRVTQQIPKEVVVKDIKPTDNPREHLFVFQDGSQDVIPMNGENVQTVEEVKEGIRRGEIDLIYTKENGERVKVPMRFAGTSSSSGQGGSTASAIAPSRANLNQSGGPEQTQNGVNQNFERKDSKKAEGADPVVPKDVNGHTRVEWPTVKQASPEAPGGKNGAPGSKSGIGAMVSQAAEGMAEEAGKGAYSGGLMGGLTALSNTNASGAIVGGKGILGGMSTVLSTMFTWAIIVGVIAGVAALLLGGGKKK